MGWEKYIDTEKQKVPPCMFHPLLIVTLFPVFGELAVSFESYIAYIEKQLKIYRKNHPTVEDGDFLFVSVWSVHRYCQVYGWG